MSTAVRLRAIGAWLLVAWFTGGCAGTDDEKATDLGGAERSVCAECPVLAGGESSDFGGTPHPCRLFELRSAIDRARASQLGFDVDRLEQRLARRIDASFHWVPREPRGGGPASGYEPETRIAGAARGSGSYTYVGLDPERCDGAACSDPEQGDWDCTDRLELGVEGDLRTLDGAVSFTASGYLLQGRDGDSFGETPAGSLRVNLRDVRGSLRLFPDPGSMVVEGLLLVDLFLAEGETEGDLRPALVVESSAMTALHYVPLAGRWPGESARPREDAPAGAPEP